MLNTYDAYVTAHSIYNKAVQDELVPGAGYITLLRRPHSHLSTSWKYWRITESAKLSSSRANVALEGFLQDPDGVGALLQRGHDRLVRNSFAFDLGIGMTPRAEKVDMLIAEVWHAPATVTATGYQSTCRGVLARVYWWGAALTTSLVPLKAKRRRSPAVSSRNKS